MVKTDYRIIAADFNNPQHFSDVLTVLENYKTDDMGVGKAYYQVFCSLQCYGYPFVHW